jgi:hypothetical protein
VSRVARGSLRRRPRVRRVMPFGRHQLLRRRVAAGRLKRREERPLVLPLRRPVGGLYTRRERRKKWRESETKQRERGKKARDRRPSMTGGAETSGLS